MTTDITTNHLTNPNGRGLVVNNLPHRLLQSFQLALVDPDVLEATDDIALLIARRDDLLAKLGEGNFGPGLWDDLRKTFERFKTARRAAAKGSSAAAERMATELRNLEELIARGYHEELIWSELRQVIEQRRKVAATEFRRRERAEEIVSKAQFKTLLGYVVNSIQTRVSDKSEAMAVLADIQNLQF